MTIEAVHNFREMVRNDTVVEAELRGAMGANGGLDLSRAVQLGEQHGFHFTAQDVVDLFAGEDAELSDLELEMVAAGSSLTPNSDGA